MGVFANAEVLCNRNYHFFLVSWVALSRTCNPKLRVSLVCLWSWLPCAMGNVGMEHFLCLTPLHALLKFLWLVYLLFTSHLFQWLGNALITDLFCIWSWLCEDHWILIPLFAFGDTAAVCVPGRLWMLLCVAAASRAQQCPGTVGSHHVLLAAGPTASAAQSCQGSLRALKCGGGRTGGQQEEKSVGRSSPRRISVLPCTINIAKETAWNSYSYMEVVQNPSSFKQGIKDTDWLALCSKVLLWPSLESFTTLTGKPRDRNWNCMQVSETILECVYAYHLISVSTKIAKWENAQGFFLPIFNLLRFIIFCVQMFEQFFVRL